MAFSHLITHSILGEGVAIGFIDPKIISTSELDFEKAFDTGKKCRGRALVKRSSKNVRYFFAEEKKYSVKNRFFG